MAERTVSVRLLANVDQYRSSMRQATAATQTLTKDGQVNFARLGTSMQSVGRAATVGLSVPLVAAGGLAVKTAADFDGAFTRMQTLAGVTGDEIGGMRDQVLELAGETGRAPQELAEGLYFLRSSGLDAGEAMDALVTSAKASAAGLGDTATIADAVSSAMNAYGSDVLSAADASDILIGTIREGKAEPTELAASIGRVIAPAQALSVEFHEVGAALAAMSLVGLDAAESTTALRGILMALQNPTKEQADALADMGLNLQQVRDVVAEQGLLAGLQMLAQGVGDNEEAMSALFGNVRALNGVLIMTGENMDQTATVADRLANSAGNTDAAFATWADSMGAKNAKAFAEFQAALIQAGEVILPVVTKILSGAADIASAFSDLPGPVQTAIIAFGGFVALAGPLAIFAGAVIRNLTLIGVSMDGLKLKAATTWPAVVGGFVVAGAALAEGAGGADRKVGALTESGERLTAGMFYATAAIDSAAGAATNATDPVTALGAATEGTADRMVGASSAAQIFASGYQDSLIGMSSAAEIFAHTSGEALNEAEAAAMRAAGAADELRTAWDRLIGTGLSAQEAVDSQVAALDDLAERVRNVRAQEQLRIAARQERRRGDDEAADAFVREADALGEISLALDNSTEAGRENRQMIRENVAAIQTRTAAELEDGRSTQRVAEIYREQRAALIDQVSAFTGSRTAAREYVNQLGLTPRNIRTLIEENANEAKGRVRGFSDEVRDVPGSATTNVRANIDRGGLDSFISTVNTLDGRVITVFTRVAGGTFGQRAAGGRVTEAMSLVGEQGPELVSLPVGSFVHTASATQAMLGGVQSFANGGTVAGFPAGERVRNLLRDSAEAAARADQFRKEAAAFRDQAAALTELAKATEDAEDKAKLLEDRDQLLEKAERKTERAHDARTKAIDKAEAAADRHASAIQRESDALQKEADALRRNADALRDEARAAVEAGDKRAEALRERAESLRQAFTAEQQLRDAVDNRRTAQEELNEANKQQTVAGVTTFIHTEEERAEALQKAREAALAVADAEVALARERAQVRGRRFTDIDAAQALRESLREQGATGLIGRLGIRQQIALLRQANREAAAGRAAAADIRRDARLLDKNARAVQQNSNALDRLSNRVDRLNLARPINLAINQEGVVTERQVVRLIRRALDGVG